MAQSLRDWLRGLELCAEVTVSFLTARQHGGRSPRPTAQMHVVPMGDVTHKFLWSTVLDKVRIYHKRAE